MSIMPREHHYILRFIFKKYITFFSIFKIIMTKVYFQVSENLNARYDHEANFVTPVNLDSFFGRMDFKDRRLRFQRQ